MPGSLYLPDAAARDTLVQPWDEAFRVRTVCSLPLPRADPVCHVPPSVLPPVRVGGLIRITLTFGPETEPNHVEFDIHHCTW
jgi:hypothetical protein